MKSFHPVFRSAMAASVVAVVLVAAVAIVPWRLAAAPPSAVDSSADPAKAATSVTVFPVVLNSGAPMPGVSRDMSQKMAEVIGLMLERAGMKDVEIADAKFTPPQDADVAKTAEAFGQFVPSQKLKTDHALFVQFFGTPGQGADEIRLAVVDRQGKVVLTDRMDRHQLLSRGAKKVDPMLACSYAVHQLRGLWNLADPNRKNAPEGKMAKLWAEKSALPPKAELEAIRTRTKTLKQTIKTSTLAVFVRVSGANDAKAAEGLAAMLGRAELGQAQAAASQPKLQVQPNTNQMRILWDTARAFQDFVRKNPPSANYALLADYGIGRSLDGKTVVGGVEVIVCNRAGDWVLVGLQNNHHPQFQQINPVSPDDCNRLVVEMLKSDLR